MLGAEPPTEFEIFSLLGNNCLLNLIHAEVGEEIYCNIDSIIKNKSIEVVQTAENPLVALDLDDFNQVIYDSLPDWKQEVIAKSPEYAEYKMTATD